MSGLAEMFGDLLGRDSDIRDRLAELVFADAKAAGPVPNLVRFVDVDPGAVLVPAF